MIIDCDACEARGRACQDCVVTVLLGPPPARWELAADEEVAIGVLAGSGLVPPLRLVGPERPVGGAAATPAEDSGSGGPSPAEPSGSVTRSPAESPAAGRSSRAPRGRGGSTRRAAI